MSVAEDGLNRFFVFCVRCNCFVDTWPANKPLPYFYTCPRCGLKDKTWRLRKWNGGRFRRKIVFVYGSNPAYKKLREMAAKC